MEQFVYFAALLFLCGTGDSLETTTSPQQQNTGDTKDLCKVKSRESNPLLGGSIVVWRFGGFTGVPDSRFEESIKYL